MWARMSVGDRELAVDLSRPVSLALALDFSGPQPRFFGAPRASARALETADGSFQGSVARGSGCNCEVLTLVPHCNGTHTESAGHLTRERLDAWRVIPAGPVPALLVSVTPQAAGSTGSEGTVPAPQPGDRLITRAALEQAWPARLPFAPRALIVRTLPNEPAKRTRDYTGSIPPYLTREAAQLAVERDIRHLVVDVPSVDRAHDEGRLTAHRVFFGLPVASFDLADAARADATITELAFAPDEAVDGPCLLEIQAPALGGDAVPSRPLLFPVRDRVP